MISRRYTNRLLYICHKSYVREKRSITLYTATLIRQAVASHTNTRNERMLRFILMRRRMITSCIEARNERGTSQYRASSTRIITRIEVRNENVKLIGIS